MVALNKADHGMGTAQPLSLLSHELPYSLGKPWGWEGDRQLQAAMRPRAGVEARL